jgi:hypothetical protein
MVRSLLSSEAVTSTVELSSPPPQAVNAKMANAWVTAAAAGFSANLMSNDPLFVARLSVGSTHRRATPQRRLIA